MTDSSLFALAEMEGSCPECGASTPAYRFGGADPIQPLCPDCSATAEALEAFEARQHDVEVQLDRAGGGARMRGWSFATYPGGKAQREALVVARSWVDGYLEGDRRNLILYGSVGGGKTGLAWSIVREVIERGGDALIVTFRELLADLKLSFDDRSAGLPTDYLRAPHVGVLGLDDIGAERPTDFARDELASLIERRYSNRLPMVITSNYEPGDLARRLGHDELMVGERMVSRLAEGAVQHRITGRDLRS